MATCDRGAKGYARPPRKLDLASRPGTVLVAVITRSSSWLVAMQRNVEVGQQETFVRSKGSRLLFCVRLATRAEPITAASV